MIGSKSKSELAHTKGDLCKQVLLTFIYTVLRKKVAVKQQLLFIYGPCFGELRVTEPSIKDEDDF